MTRDELRKVAEAVEVTAAMPWYRAKDLDGDVRIQCAEDAAYIIAASPAVVLGLLDDLAAAESRLAAGRALHWPQPYADADLREVSPSLPKDVCAHCRSTGDGAVPWPCPTIRALDGRADS